MHDDNNLPFLPYGCQTIDDEDVEAVLDTLRSPYLTTGPAVPAFEQALAAAVGAEHAVAVSNGTAALHAACFAAEVGPGDEVIVPAITFVASANCVRYMGGTPVFVDVDPETGLTDAQAIYDAITPRTVAAIPVHMTGRPVDLEAIGALCQEREITLVEDAAHALGGSFDGHKIGDCRYSHMAISSFHPVKHITTGEGGAITTNDPRLDRRLRIFRDHGLARTDDQFERPSPGPWYYEQQELGYNLRLSAIQCALGTSQLRKLPQFIARRHAVAAQYDALLEDVPHVTPIGKGDPRATSAYHLYAVLIDFEAAGKDRAQVMNALRDRRIGTQVHYIPVPSQPYYERLGWKMEAFPGAQAYYEKTLSIPMYPTMTEGDVKRVVEALGEVLG